MWWLLLLALLAGCRVVPAGAPVPVTGANPDLAELAGRWAGRYWTDAGQGHGTITFALAAGADTARGQVEMTFAPALRLYGEVADGADLSRRPCATLDIAVVRVQGASIRGTLAPYWNPTCDCRTVSVFDGEIAGARISGTFVTRREGADAALWSGRWQLEREGR